MEVLKVNYGGFVPLSTVDWRGRAVCTVFLRGCPVRCSYCHNASILGGTDLHDIEEVIGQMASSRVLVSGVVFSGGEPTMQGEALLTLARAARALDLKVGVHTNGVFPDTLEALIREGLLDYVALDIKARWERYDNLLKGPYVQAVQRSLAICRSAWESGRLPEFEVVVTLFRGYEDEVPVIAAEAGDVDLVLQQGVQGEVPPLTYREMEEVAERIGRPVKIRTREGGERWYEGDRGRRIPCER
jgi:pyruvate formate lyase activating enzyme